MSSTPQCERDTELLQTVHCRATKKMQGLEQLCYQERLREVGFPAREGEESSDFGKHHISFNGVSRFQKLCTAKLPPWLLKLSTTNKQCIELLKR